ncbi:MAG: uroporphyrinogen-III C-methyltransferase, partial [Myxococcota bacterium]
MIGKVYLVGAGPGDPGLLTLRARECLERADVVLHDRLIPREALDFAPAQAERIDRGRRGAAGALTQEDIHRLMVARARDGKTVVRLKGGDPFVFGRGGEEAEALAAAGVPFEIVPGVTSAVAAPAFAGIPLTHRDLASAVTIVSGHDAEDGPRVPWAHLALPDTTLVLLMSLHALGENLRKLVEAGVDPLTPAAVIASGATTRQQVVVGTVADLAARVRDAGITPPALTIVGRVVSLRATLAWAERRPLHGRRVMVTRAAAQAGALAKLLRDRGAEAVLLPALETGPPESFAALDAALHALATYDWVLFTSANGVRAFFERLAHKGLDARALAGSRIGAVGPATAEALARERLRVDAPAASYRAEGLFEALRPLGVAGKRFLLPRAEKAREVLEDALRAAGATVDVVTAYRTSPAAPDGAAAARLREGTIDVVAFASASAVESFAAMGLAPGRARVAAIGPLTREACERAGLEVAIEPARATIPALVDAIETYFATP